jgi:Mn2+/Fe2+ NRAMP family transporter
MAEHASHSPIEPPVRPLIVVRYLGPGLIVAGSIVGSGELIATTKAGAEAGFTLLWLILIGCVVKVFVQIEFGRYAIISGKTTLRALDEVPGPRIAGRGNWLVWYWLLMWLASIGQLGGIVGGVGQALAISVPITSMGAEFNRVADAETLQRIEPVDEDVEALRRQYQAKYGEQASKPHDTAIWAAIIAVLTSVLLVIGRYGLIQTLSTVLVASFTMVTIANLFLLQEQPDWRVGWSDFVGGLKFRLPQDQGGLAIGTALATFGIIGVGASELVVYPYWCLERGYAKFTGRNDGSPAWTARAAGWMRVMHIDAFGAMLVYTFATVAFYLLGAATLNRAGLNPEGESMVRTLAVMYIPVFSQWASAIFLFGAFAVLYSTFFVAIAGHARTFSDALSVIGLINDDKRTLDRWVRRLSGLFPLLCLAIFLSFQQPAKLVLISGVAQGVMLPMLAAAALFFRYRRSLPGLVPRFSWDLMLWLSAVAMLVTGVWTVADKFLTYFGSA